MLPEFSGSIFIPKTSLAKFILCAEAHFMRGKRISFAEAYFMHASAFHSYAVRHFKIAKQLFQGFAKQRHFKLACEHFKRSRSFAKKGRG